MIIPLILTGIYAYLLLGAVVAGLIQRKVGRGLSPEEVCESVLGWPVVVVFWAGMCLWFVAERVFWKIGRLE